MCRGHVGVGDMWVLGTCGCGGHEGVGDLFSGGLVCLIRVETHQKETSCQISKFKIFCASMPNKEWRLEKETKVY